MKPEDFTTIKTGELVSVTTHVANDLAFVPFPLPPQWEWPQGLWPLLLDAHKALASLKGTSSLLPDSQLLIRPLMRREAVQSSNLEGTFTPPQQQALFEIDPDALDEAERTNSGYREIANYGEAIRYYFDAKIRPPVTESLIRNLHAILMRGVRGANLNPGAFRKHQVQVGRRYMPPPHYMVQECMDQFIGYVQSPPRYDPLVEAFLAHYQFESIHPFIDGNGRVGRLLLSIMVAESAGMTEPWLQMSAYFEVNRDEYIDRLYRVSTQGEWSEWVAFCLNGVVAQATDAEKRCLRLLQIRDDFHGRITTKGRASARLIRAANNLFHSPVVTIPYVERLLGVSFPTASKDIDTLVHLGILATVEGMTNPRAYYAPTILNVIYE